MDYKLDIVKIKGCSGAPWGMRMIVNDISRFRPYHYKKEAIAGMWEWEHLSSWALEREFMHNFDSAETLGITSITS